MTRPAPGGTAVHRVCARLPSRWRVGTDAKVNNVHATQRCRNLTTLNKLEKSSVHNGVAGETAGAVQRGSRVNEPRSAESRAMRTQSDETLPLFISLCGTRSRCSRATG